MGRSLDLLSRISRMASILVCIHERVPDLRTKSRGIWSVLMLISWNNNADIEANTRYAPFNDF